jgi:hypothetical protein
MADLRKCRSGRERETLDGSRKLMRSRYRRGSILKKLLVAE